MLTRFLVTASTALIVTCLLSTAPVRAENNLLFILDSSGSMWGQLDGKTKMETAKAALSKLIGDLPADTGVGLMVYGHRLGRKEPGACADIQLVKAVGRATSEGVAGWLGLVNPKGKTPIAGALRQAPGAFAGLEKFNNNIVLISDGIETCDGDPCAVAGELAKSNINVRVHVVGFDISEKDRVQLECIAEFGKGKYFPANSTEDFTRAVTEAVRVAQAETEPAPSAAEPTPAQPVVYFEDNFDGEDLGEHWEVLKPNPDGFIVEDGKLLIVSGTPGSLASETVENVFKLSKSLPRGDWTLTAKFSVEFQTWYERAFVGIFDNRNNYLEISLQSIVGEYGLNRYPAFDVVGVKRSRGNDKKVSRRLWRGPNTGDYSNVGNFAEGTKAFPQPVLLRLSKQGRNYVGSVMMEGAEEPAWLNLDSFKILRQKGTVAIGLYQTQEVKGEAAINVDWVKIETPPQ